MNPPSSRQFAGSRWNQDFDSGIKSLSALRSLRSENVILIFSVPWRTLRTNSRDFIGNDVIPSDIAVGRLFTPRYVSDATRSETSRRNVKEETTTTTTAKDGEVFPGFLKKVPEAWALKGNVISTTRRRHFRKAGRAVRRDVATEQSQSHAPYTLIRAALPRARPFTSCYSRRLFLLSSFFHFLFHFSLFISSCFYPLSLLPLSRSSFIPAASPSLYTV